MGGSPLDAQLCLGEAQEVFYRNEIDEGVSDVTTFMTSH